MPCCHCQDVERLFDDRVVRKELQKYRKKGVKKTTRMLLDAIRAVDTEASTLLDIGGGIGEVSHELLGNGVVSQAISVEAAAAYIEGTREEARRQGHEERLRFYHGDFVDLAAEIPEADIVTLDRVICCYPDFEALVTLSAARARKMYAVVYPRELWWIRVFFAIQNFFIKLSKNAFRMYVHPTAQIEALIQQRGLQRRFFRKTFFWQLMVYEKGKIIL